MSKLSLRCLSIGLPLFVISAPVRAQNTGDALPANTSILQVVPPDGDVGVALDRSSMIRFSIPIDTATVDSSSIAVSAPGGPVPTSFTFSLSRRVVRIHYPAFLPPDAVVSIAVDGDLLLDVAGHRVDGDGDGHPGGTGVFTFETGPESDPPLDTASAFILGNVWEADGVTPIQGATVQSFYYPAAPGDMPINVPDGVADASGAYFYTTIPFTGEETFLVRISRTGYSEKLEQVTLIAGGCWRVDALLVPLAPAETVFADSGGTLVDPTGEAELVIPGGALASDSNIALTVLEDASLLRDSLPPLVADKGRYTDIDGVFGDETSAPVTMRVPNDHNLPLGTRIPFGKIDHFTLEWIDLRDAYTGPPPVPDEYLGKVVSDGAGGTVIEVQFDHFCSTCTSHCGDVPEPKPEPGGPDSPGPPPDCSGNPSLGEGTVRGTSYVGQHEGFLWERIELPTVTEFGRETGPGMLYCSATARPTATVRAAVDFESPREVERTSFRFELEGLIVEAVYGFSEDNMKHHATFIWDGKNGFGQSLPTGSYPYSMQATSLNAESQVAVPDVFGGPSVQAFAALYPGLLAVPTEIVTERVMLVDLTDSPYGAGWMCTMESRLYFDGDGRIVEVDGGGTWNHFTPMPGSTVFWERTIGAGFGIVRNPQTGFYTLENPSGETLVYDQDGLLSSRIHADGQSTEYIYDSASLLTSITTATGFQWSFFYDAGGKIQSIADSVGRQTLFTVDGAGDLVGVTNAVGASRSFVYDAEHLLVQNNGPRGEYSQYQFTNGRVVGTFTYDTDGTTLLAARTFAPSVLNGEMGAALAAGEGTLANPIPIEPSRKDVFIDGRGVTFVHIADENGRTIEVRNGLGLARKYEYNDDGQRTSVTVQNGAKQEFDYDAEGRLTQVRQYRETGALYSTETVEYVPGTHDVSRRVDAEGKQTLYEYDGQGRVIRVVDDMGQATVAEYGDPVWPNLLSRITYPGGYVREMTYDNHGNGLSVTDYPDAVGRPQGRTQTIVHDAAGNQAVVVSPEGFSKSVMYDELNRVTSYTDELSRTVAVDYSENGAGGCGCSTVNMSSVTLADLSRIEFEYDGLNRRITRRDASGVAATYEYDAEGLSTARTNRAGELVVLEYDDARRRVRKELPGGDVTTFEYDELGALTYAADAECQLEFERDFLGRATTARTFLDEALRGGFSVALEHTLDSTYDRVGNLLTLRDSTGLVEYDYTYDDLHRLTDIVPASRSDGWILGYSPRGKLTSIDRQIAGIMTAIARDDAEGVVSIQHGTPANIQADYTSYNGLGHLTQASVQLLGQTFGAAFEYSDDRRLTSATTGQVHGDQQVNLTYTVDSASRLQSDGEYSYTYDAAGRLSTRASIASSIVEEFDWDAENALIAYREVDTATTQTLLEILYTYDPLGRRVAKSVNGVIERFVYLGDDIVLSLDGRNDAEWAFVHGPGTDDPLAAVDVIDGEVYELLRDRQQNVIALADSSGALVQEYLYGEYGNVLERSSSKIRQPYGFASRERDLETGLYFNRARYYEPGLGRFITEDPIGLGGGWNPYEYVESNPVNLLDPYGLSSQCGGDDCWMTVFQACVERIKRDNKDMLDALEDALKGIDCITNPVACWILPSPWDPLFDPNGGGFDLFLWQCRAEADATCGERP